MCPPSSSPTRSARSRLTRVPGCQVPSTVLDRVSAEASTANQSGPSSTTVRQQPEQAMEAPMAGWSAQACSMTSRMSRPALIGAMLRTRPTALMIPVNIRRPFGIRS